MNFPLNRKVRRDQKKRLLVLVVSLTQFSNSIKQLSFHRSLKPIRFFTSSLTGVYPEHFHSLSAGSAEGFGTGFGMTKAVLQYRKHKGGSVISTP
jgi:hypothetical protein